MATTPEVLVAILRSHVDERMQAMSSMAAHTVDGGQRAYATGALRELRLLASLLDEAAYIEPS